MLALAAERAAERDEAGTAETAQQASRVPRRRRKPDRWKRFAGLDPNDVDPAELLGETGSARRRAGGRGRRGAPRFRPAQVEAPVKDAPRLPLQRDPL